MIYYEWKDHAPVPSDRRKYGSSMRERAFITGILGQDGSYLNEALLGAGVATMGSDRMALFDGLSGLDRHPFDIGDSRQVRAWVADWKPTQIYHLAAVHGSSEDCTEDAADLFAQSLRVHAVGLANLLEAIRLEAPEARLVFAGSSRVFGAPVESPQTEKTPMRPISPYGISKAAGVSICAHYRNEYGVHSSSAILYNHESPRRSANYVTQKIVRAGVAIKRGKQRRLILGDLGARVDWAHAADYVDALRLIADVNSPGEFVVASGELNSVRDFGTHVFGCLGLDFDTYVEEDRKLIKSVEPQAELVGNSDKLKQMTGWKPKFTLQGLASDMVDAEISRTSVNDP